MKNTRLIILLLLFELISVFSFSAYAQEDEDWKLIARNVRIVNLEKGQSLKGNIYRNIINCKFAFLPESEKNDTMYYVEHSDRPSYDYMFIYGDAMLFNKGKWYFNYEKGLELPIENDMMFISVIRAVSGTRSNYFRLFRSIVDNSLTVVGEDPFFGYIVYKSDDSHYRYMFRANGIYWYSNL